MTERLRIKARILPDGSPKTVVGRDAWMLQNLMCAGEIGCTSIDHPGARVAHYVFKLRGFGFLIETVEEKHAVRSRPPCSLCPPLRG